MFARLRTLRAVHTAIALWGVMAVVFVGAGAIWARANAKARDAKRARYAAFADAHGLSYIPDPADKGLFERFDQSVSGVGAEKPFGRGQGRRAENVLYGTVRGHTVCAFTYIFKVTRNNGENSTTTTYRWSVVTVALPAGLPPIEIGDEGLFDGFGLGGVQFESQTFNDRFKVTCDQSRFASAFVHPRMIGLMLDRQRGITRVRGDLLVNVEEREPEPDDLASTWDYLIDVAELVPPFVIADYGQRTHGSGRDR